MPHAGQNVDQNCSWAIIENFSIVPVQVGIPICEFPGVGVSWDIVSIHMAIRESFIVLFIQCMAIIYRPIQ